MSDFKEGDIVKCIRVCDFGVGWIEIGKLYIVVYQDMIKPMLGDKYPNGFPVGEGIILDGNGEFETI